jgi:AraC family transcriptional regulator
MLNCGVPVELELEDAESITATVDPSFFKAVVSQSGVDRLELPDHLPRAADPQVAWLLMTMWDELRMNCPGGRMFGELLTSALAVHLVRRYAMIPSSLQQSLNKLPYKLPSSVLRQIREYVESHLDEEVRLCQLAQLAGLSPYHFLRSFKGSTGVTPHKYVVKQRIERSKQLLKDTGLPLVTIANIVGFQTQSRFSTVFRECVGVTPGTYRKQTSEYRRFSRQEGLLVESENS